jgi:hypothetical protein
MIDWLGLLPTIVIANSLQILFGAFVAVPILEFQIATFIVYGIARQFVIGPYFYTCATM